MKHHKSHHDDYASRFKRRSLQSITFRRNAEKWLKLSLFVLAVLMILIVLVAYLYRIDRGQLNDV